MNNKELLQQAYELGFLRCAEWANRGDLLSEPGSMEYAIKCARDLTTITQPAQPTSHYCTLCGTHVSVPCNDNLCPVEPAQPESKP